MISVIDFGHLCMQKAFGNAEIFLSFFFYTGLIILPFPPETKNTKDYAYLYFVI